MAMFRKLVVLIGLSAALGTILYQREGDWDLRQHLSERTLGDVSYAEGSPSVLFVGNSFVFVNDLPRTFARLARSRGDAVGVGSFAQGGQTLMGHAGSPQLAELIRSRPWDFVVLQEQSQRPAFGPATVEVQTIAPALRLAATIRAAHPASRVVFYETWGRRDGDQDNCASIPALCTFKGMQERLNASYAQMAARAPGVLARVGEAWDKVRQEHPEVDLYAGDGVHPSAQGTYLAACVFYATLLNKPSVGASALGVDKAQALLLQRAADAVALGR